MCASDYGLSVFKVHYIETWKGCAGEIFASLS